MKSAKTSSGFGRCLIVRMLSVVAGQLDANEQKQGKLQKHDDAACKEARPASVWLRALK